MLLFLVWSILNIYHDFLYKKIHMNIVLILYIKFLFIFLFSFILILFFLKKIRNISKESLEYLFKWNHFKSIFSIFGMYCGYKQIIIFSFFSLNLMFYTIPLWELIINYLLNGEKINVKKNLFLGINNLIIFVYFTYNIYINGIYNYIYGFLSAIMFGIANLLIFKTKEVWKKNHYFVIVDICIFSFWMLFFILQIINFNKMKININIFTSTFSSYYIYIYFIIGLIIQYLLYYFFSRDYENPSIILSNIDLISSFLLDFFLKKEYNIIEVLVILIIIVNKYLQKKLHINKN